jgi:GntR family uxuAB operon transcriptional repressor
MALKLIHPASTTMSKIGQSPMEKPYQRLAANIHELVKQGEFKVGDRLPSERALAERFDVSRTLGARGHHCRWRSRARSRCAAARASTSARASPDAPTRRRWPTAATGPRALRAAARALPDRVRNRLGGRRERARTADLDRIFAALAAMREHMHDKAANEAADRLFHLRIAESTGNSVLLQMVTALWDHKRARSGRRWRRTSTRPRCAAPRRTTTSACSTRCSSACRGPRRDARAHRTRDRRVRAGLALSLRLPRRARPVPRPCFALRPIRACIPRTGD